MKTVEEYMSLPYRMEIVSDSLEGGYVISYPDLPGCLSSGKDIVEAIRNGEAAKREWFVAAIESGYQISEPDRLSSYSGRFKLRIPKTLHRKLVIQAKNEGVSLNQYCVYLLSKNSNQI